MLKDITNFIIEYKFIIIPLVIIIITLILFWSITYLKKWLSWTKNITPLNSLPSLDVNALNNDLEPFGFAYDQDQDLFFSIMNAWQRNYGYGKPYDKTAPLISLIIDCEPIYFNYDNKEWLIEFWKGQYGMTTGAEIGIYAMKNINTSSNMDDIIYESITDDECLSLSYILKKNGKVLLTRSGRHWWLTGFKLGLFSKPSELIMDIVIILKNRKMCNAFIDGLKKAGYQDCEIDVINNTVYLSFYKPHTPQPKAKIPLITYFMQSNNRQYCKIYNFITKDYDNTLDKLNFIRKHFPAIYTQLMNFGKTKQLFKNYKPPNNK